MFFTRARQLLLLLVLCLFVYHKASAQGVQTLKPNVYINANCNGYIEYLPEGYNSGNERYPLLLYINGMGSTGSGSLQDLENHFSGGGFPHEQIRAGSFPASFTVNGQTFRFIIITPQFKTPYWQRAPTPQEVNDVVNFSIQNYRVDTTRIYMAGNSSGGGPVWDYVGAASAYANRIAAILPFCGVSFPAQVKANIIKNAKVAVWAFHNEFDPGVPVSFTRDWVAMINSAPAPAIPAKINVFPDAGHGCWYAPLTRTFTENGINVYQWLLTHKRTPTRAFAGNDQEINLPQSSAQLNGGGSGPNGSVIGWNWQKVGGPGGGSLSSTNAQNPSVSGLSQGIYTYRLTVTDNSGATATDDVSITVTPAPQRIEAEAFSAMSGVLIENTSDAGGGQNLTYIEANDWIDYNITVPSAGYYTVRFRVAAAYNGAQFLVKNTAGELLTTIDMESTGGWQTYATYTKDIRLSGGSQTIRILSTTNMGWNFNWLEIIGGAGGGNPPPPPPNNAPTANAGTDKNISLPTNSVQLSGSGADSDGSISTYAWTQVSGPSAAGIQSPAQAQTTINNLQQGSYTFRLTVTDNNGATGFDDVAVTVNAAPNTAPAANAGADKNIVLPTNSVQLSGSGTDNDGSITAYAWTQVSGPSTAGIQSATQAQTTVNNLQQGSYTFRLTVTDNNGATGFDDVVVNVSAAPNTPPLANAGTDNTITLPTNSVQLNGSGSDNGGWITAYAWTQVSGPSTASIGSPSNASTTVSSLVAGSYTFRLTVTDNNGATATDDVAVVVNSPSNVSPSANAGSDQTVTGTANSAQLNGSGSDPDGSISAYAWSQVSGPSSASFSSPNAASTYATNLVAGVYVFRLTVTDNSGATASDDATVTVNAPPPPPTGSNRIEAENWTNMSGVQTESTSDAGGGLNVGWIDNSDWMEYGLSVPSAGNYTLKFRVASTNNNAQFQVKKQDGTILATVNVPNTGGWQSWQTVTAVISVPATQNVIRLQSIAADNWNINWIEFEAGGTVNPPPPPPTSGNHIEAELYTSQSGTQNEGTSDVGGGQNVGYIDHGDWMQYSLSIPSAGNYTLSFRIATPNTGARFEVRNAQGAVLGTVDIPQTGGWQTWQTTTTVVSLPQGTQTIRLQSVGSPWNINWLEFAPAGTTPPPPPPPTGGSNKIEAENYTNMSGVQTESTADAGGGLNVGYIDNGDWMDYNINPSTTGAYTINFRVATEWNGAQFQVKRLDGTVLATVSVPNTGGWQNWQTISATVNLTAGSQAIRLQSVNGTNWNINWLELVGGTTTPPPTTSNRIEAESYTSQSGTQNEGTSDAGGGQNVGYIDAGDWMEYNISTSSAGTYTMRFRVASQWNGAQFQVRNSSGSVLATVNVPNTGGWQTWQTIEASVPLAGGAQTIRLVSMNSNNWNINWLEIASGASFTSVNREMQTETAAITEMSGKVSIYPNPVQDRFSLEVDDEYTGNLRVEIVNMNGAVQRGFSLVKQGGKMVFQLGTGNLPQGSYILTLRGKGYSKNVRMIKK